MLIKMIPIQTDFPDMHEKSLGYQFILPMIPNRILLINVCCNDDYINNENEKH